MSSRLDYADFHDHASDLFNNTLEGFKVKGIKFDQFKAAIDATLSGKVTASLDYDRKKDYFLTATVKANSQGQVKPSVAYEKAEHKLVANYADASLKYQYKVAALGGAITTSLIDGLCSDIHGSTIFDNVYQAGFAATYDPSRSGLKKLSYGVRAAYPSFWKKGSLSVSSEGPKNYKLGVSYQCCDSTVLLAMLQGWKSYESTFGFQYTSICGGSTTFYANLKGCSAESLELGTTIKKNVRGTDITIGALVNPSTFTKKFGCTVGI